MKRPVSDRHRAGGWGWCGWRLLLSRLSLSCTRCLRSAGCQMWARISALLKVLLSWMNLGIASSCPPRQHSPSACLVSPYLYPLCVSASKQFAEEVLRSHNEYRRKHQVPPLKLCSKLSKDASRWVIAHTRRHTHRHAHTYLAITSHTSGTSLDNWPSLFQSSLSNHLTSKQNICWVSGFVLMIDVMLTISCHFFHSSYIHFPYHWCFVE